MYTNRVGLWLTPHRRSGGAASGEGRSVLFRRSGGVFRCPRRNLHRPGRKTIEDLTPCGDGHHLERRCLYATADQHDDRSWPRLELIDIATTFALRVGASAMVLLAHGAGLQHCSRSRETFQRAYIAGGGGYRGLQQWGFTRVTDPLSPHAIRDRLGRRRLSQHERSKRSLTRR